LISLGGGSPIDSTMIAVKELSENFAKPIIAHLAIPTTLSAAEFSHSAGMTDDTSKRKTGIRDPRLVPRFIFLDPKITVDTPSWYHILPDTCRGNEAPGSEASRQACADCSGRRTGPERPQREQTSHVRSRASRRVSQRPQTLQKAERLRNQERGSTIACKRRLWAGRILHDVTSSRRNTLAAGRVKALTPTKPADPAQPPEKSGSDKM